MKFIKRGIILYFVLFFVNGYPALAVPITDFSVYTRWNLSTYSAAGTFDRKMGSDSAVNNYGTINVAGGLIGNNITNTAGIINADVTGISGVLNNSGATITGNVTTSLGATIDNRGIIEGAQQYAARDSLTPLLADAWLPAHSISPGSDSYTLSYGQSLTLSPGHYGTLRTYGNNKIYLSSGEYHFQSIYLSNGNLYLDVTNGQISIYTADIFVYDQNSNTLLSKNNGLSYSQDKTLAGLVYNEGRSFILMSNTGWFGTTYSPYGSISSSYSVYGALYGGNVNLYNYSNVEYVPLSQPIPEPATLSLLGLGLLGLVFKKKKTI